ncbi:MAG: tlde1 domain-containing protein [Bacteroidota bacterium]
MLHQLTFNIATRDLSGIIGQKPFSALAVSGGRSGSTTAGAVNSILANNPFLTGHKLEKGGIGGALPLGFYKLSAHESKSHFIRLTPDKGNQMHGRDGFLIHPRGHRGSDGCIVLKETAKIDELLKFIKEWKEDGKTIVLEVMASGDLDQFYPFTQTA